MSPRARRATEPTHCILCGQAPMPVITELPDGTLAHPGCATDPALAEQRAQHDTPTQAEQ